jgi:trans-aconitate methyltransferase
MQFNQNDKERLLAYYQKLATNHADNTSQTQGWASNETQRIRYDVFTKIGDLNNSSVLDVGCGFGDFYDFLKNKGLTFSYEGIDINSAMLKVAKERHSNIAFQETDFGSYNSNKKFDYVFCSGALSFKTKDYKNLYFSYIKKMFELSTIGVAFNMLNSKNNVTPEDEAIFATYEISEVQEFCKQLTEKITVTEGYLPNDFTFFLYH